jgi:hypothetical protein
MIDMTKATSSEDITLEAPGLDAAGKKVTGIFTFRVGSRRHRVKTPRIRAVTIKYAERGGQDIEFTLDDPQEITLGHLQFQRLLESRELQEALVSAMLPSDPPAVPDETRVLMARRNAEARSRLLEEFGYLRADEIAEGRSRASNRGALASRWAREGRIFAVDWHAQRLYPAFQFAEDRSPLPAIAAVLDALPRDEMSEWEVALWWTAANGWLRNARPVDVLLEDPDAASELLASAAAHLAEPSPL